MSQLYLKLDDNNKTIAQLKRKPCSVSIGNHAQKAGICTLVEKGKFERSTL